MNKLIVFWRQRPVRERWLAAFATVLTLAQLVNGLVLSPLKAYPQHQSARLSEMQRYRATLDHHLPMLLQLKRQLPAQRQAPVSDVLAEVAAAHHLTLSQTAENGGLTLAPFSIRFSQLMVLLQQLEQQAAIQVMQIQITRQSATDDRVLVSRMVLSRHD